MSIKKAQYDVHKWVSQFKVEYFTPLEMLAQMTEEVGELARELNNRFGPRTKKSPKDTADISEELSDIMFAIICMANFLEIDLDEAWEKKMNKQYGRDKERFELKD